MSSRICLWFNETRYSACTVKSPIKGIIRNLRIFPFRRISRSIRKKSFAPYLFWVIQKTTSTFAAFATLAVRTYSSCQKHVSLIAWRTFCNQYDSVDELIIRIMKNFLLALMDLAVQPATFYFSLWRAVKFWRVTMIFVPTWRPYETLTQDLLI